MKDTNFMLFATGRTSKEDTEYVPVSSLGLEFIQEDTDVPGKKKITLINSGKDAFVGVIKIEIAAKCRNPQFFMPGFMYGDNTGDKPSSGRKEFPRIRRGNCRRPESEDWMVRSDRLAYPMSLVYDGGRIYGISAAPYLVLRSGEKKVCFKEEGDAFYQYGGFTCTVNSKNAAAYAKDPKGCYASAGFTLGYENAPWLFIQTATVREREPLTEQNAIVLAVGERLVFELFLFDYRAHNVTGIYEAMIQTYERFHQKPRSVEGMTREEAIRYLAEAVSEAAYLEEDKMYSGFVFDREEGYEYNKLGSLSWTNGLSVATPMLMAGLALENEKIRQQALECIEEIISHCMNPESMLPYDAVSNGIWSIHGWWYDGMHTPGHSGYLCGQALYYVLKAYDYEIRMKGQEHKEYLEFTEPIIRKLLTTLNSEFEFPFSMSEETGAGLEYDSLGGCWCLTAMVYYMYLTGEYKYLPLLERVEQHYFEKYVLRVQCYGGPLDTDKATDNEGILSFIRAARYFHMITDDPKYLDHLRSAILYECSFKLCYNTPVSIPPLSTIGWSSCGGSITSVANPHIHPMSSTITPEMMYYLKQRPDEFIRDRLEDTVSWGLQTFNTYDKEYGYGKRGWMSERFCFCQGLVTEKYPDQTPASTWFALMPWASASIIEGFFY